jgi:hypothetical protein
MLTPAPLAYKPDLEDAARRWDAFYAGEIIDRPIVCVTAPRAGGPPGRGSSYHDRVFGDMDDIIERFLITGEGTYYAGEAIPAAWLSFGPDEVGVFCGAELGWSDDSGDTNWSIPFVEDWEEALPLRLQEDHPLWLRMLEFHRRAADKLAGKMLLTPLDLHTNMDLLAAIRGPQRLCEDTLDCPELLDQAMDDARAIFRQVWRATAEAGRMDELGYTHCCYSMEGAAVLQCDWCCMVSPAMFRRWVLPALEEEAEIVKHAIYHWDGPGAIVHTDDLIASKGLLALSYVPGAGHGGHIDYLDLLKRVQAGGKAVQVWGSPDEMKIMHGELKPELTIYCTGCGSEADAEALLEWFVANT